MPPTPHYDVSVLGKIAFQDVDGQPYCIDAGLPSRSPTAQAKTVAGGIKLSFQPVAPPPSTFRLDHLPIVSGAEYEIRYVVIQDRLLALGIVQSIQQGEHFVVRPTRRPHCVAISRVRAGLSSGNRIQYCNHHRRHSHEPTFRVP